MSGASITAEPPPRAAPPEHGDGRSRYRTGALFLLPAFILLGVWLVYPTVYTIVRSFFGQSGYLGTWVGIDNYRTLFTTSTLVTAIKNSAIWVAVVPAFVMRVRPPLRRPHRAHPLVGCVQDGHLPADGDLRLRHRRHLADHVPAEPGPGSDQRPRAHGLGCRHLARSPVQRAARRRRPSSRRAAAWS